MLQRFNKLAFCLASAIIATNVQASEYIVSNYDDNNKPQIYDILSKYRFPSILSPFIQKEFNNKYPNLNLMETFKTKESEHQFIQNAVQKIDPKAKVYAITKSLYQFMTYNYLNKEIKVCEDPEKDVFAELYNQKEKFDLRNHAKEGEEWGLTKACNHFMENEKIKDIFWGVNEHSNDLYQKHNGQLEPIVNELLDAYKAPHKVLDSWNTSKAQQLSITGSSISRIDTLLGPNSKGKSPEGWSEEKRQTLKNYTLNCIRSENKKSDYILYHCGNFDKPDLERANRQVICFSDGLGSGFIFDPGASAFALSCGQNKLYRLELDRAKLLDGQYPIFIPPAHHLLSGAGNGELFHVRTKVVQAVIDQRWKSTSNNLNEYAFSIKMSIDPLTLGYKINQTPEFFTTPDPQILLLKKDEYYNYLYEKTGQGKFDKDGSEKLKEMINNIKEVPANGIF